jgi:hypothetical protein
MICDPCTYFDREVFKRRSFNSIDFQGRVGVDSGKTTRGYNREKTLVTPFTFSGGTLTEKLFCDISGFDNFNDTRVQLFNGGDMVSENTHVTGGGSQIDLLDSGVFVDSLKVKEMG